QFLKHHLFGPLTMNSHHSWSRWNVNSIPGKRQRAAAVHKLSPIQDGSGSREASWTAAALCRFGRELVWVEIAARALVGIDSTRCWRHLRHSLLNLSLS